MLASFCYKLFYSKWNKEKNIKTPGYSVLIMVPGDLPVFLRIALDVCSAQESKRMVEAIVIPDKNPSGFLEYFRICKGNWKNCPIKLVKLNVFELLMTKYLNNPHTNNWLQFIHGCNKGNATHLLWHDADLFIKTTDFFQKHYEKCIESNFSCFGVSEVWDKWYKENGYPYLTATWELMLNLNWVKSFKPWQHRGHDGVIDGKKHTFDSTLLPQCLTKSEYISHQRNNENFIHFNYVISTYRHFQNSKGSYEDNSFRLLLVRLLVDIYDDSGWDYEVPLLAELVSGLKDKTKRVTYIEDTTRSNYKEFRNKLEQLIESNILSEERREILCQKIKPFDSHFYAEFTYS